VKKWVEEREIEGEKEMERDKEEQDSINDIPIEVQCEILARQIGGKFFLKRAIFTIVVYFCTFIVWTIIENFHSTFAVIMEGLSQHSAMICASIPPGIVYALSCRKAGEWFEIKVSIYDWDYRWVGPVVMLAPTLFTTMVSILTFLIFFSAESLLVDRVFLVLLLFMGYNLWFGFSTGFLIQKKIRIAVSELYLSLMNPGSKM
jgi:hypothetical protein